MGTKTEFTTVKGIYWSSLDWKDITQSLITNLMKDDELSILFTNDTAINGVKQYITTGLLEKQEYSKDITIAMYNPKEPAVSQQYIIMDHKWTYSIKTADAEQIQTSFSTEALKTQFKEKLVETLYASLKKDLFHFRMYTILTQKIPVNFDWSKTESFTLDNTLDLKDFTDDTNTKAGLSKIRETVLRFKTTSLEHTAFSKADKSKKFYSSFRPRDFIMLWNLPFYNKIADLTAILFNKDDVMVKQVKNIIQDFKLIEKLTDPEKTEASKTVGYLIHKDALKEVMPGDTLSLETTTINWQKLHRILKLFGLGRLKPYPIVKITNKG